MEISEIRQIDQSRKAVLEKRMQEERAAGEAKETRMRKAEASKERETEEAVKDIQKVNE